MPRKKKNQELHERILKLSGVDDETKAVLTDILNAKPEQQASKPQRRQYAKYKLGKDGYETVT